MKAQPSSFHDLCAKVALAASTLTLLTLTACVPAARTPQQATISLRIAGTPPGATVIVDEEALGTLEFVAAHGVALPPGVHHVTVKATGYFPSDQTVEAKPGSAPVKVVVALVSVPD
jgi:hypothetical protein